MNAGAQECQEMQVPAGVIATPLHMYAITSCVSPKSEPFDCVSEQRLTPLSFFEYRKRRSSSSAIDFLFINHVPTHRTKDCLDQSVCRRRRKGP